jgi:hypothetical protein
MVITALGLDANPITRMEDLPTLRRPSICGTARLRWFLQNGSKTLSVQSNDCRSRLLLEAVPGAARHAQAHIEDPLGYSKLREGAKGQQHEACQPAA